MGGLRTAGVPVAGHAAVARDVGRRRGRAATTARLFVIQHPPLVIAHNFTTYLTII